MELKVFQTLSRNEALCTQEGSNSIDVYKIVTETNILYDGQIIGGTWVLVDTYTYETKDERIKTVPVFMPLSEYKERKQWQSQLNASNAIGYRQYAFQRYDTYGHTCH